MSVEFRAVPAKRIGELLIEAKVITEPQLEEVLKLQRGGDGRKVGQLLIELKLVSETVLTQALSRQLSVPWVSLYHVDFSRSLLNLVSREAAEKYTLVPIFVRKVRKQGDTLYVAMDDPTNDVALQEVGKSAGVPVKPMIACPSDIKSAIRVYYLGETAPAVVPPPPPTPPKLPERAALTSKPDLASRDTRPDRESSIGERPKDVERAPPRPAPANGDHPDAQPEIEATEIEPRSRRGRARMVALTLLDGTTLTLPAAKKRASKPDPKESGDDAPIPDQLTARDLVSAFRAVAHGADASEILGENPPQWEAIFAALLSLMLKKGIIADWEFIEEFRKI
jgi:type IV pilus assembly protein PilB